jgi:tRNA nucleotidyltransferase/poly(A) polymerase
LLGTPGLAEVLAALPDARLVGGCVRDALAGQAVGDIDVATAQPPGAVMAALAAAGLRCVPTGLAHGTVTALSGGRGFEVTTLRRDVETDGRHAVVAWTEDWREDAARRDFTINAMSLSRDGVVHDYFDGQADLAAGIVRFVGPAAMRIEEDRLRVFRFFRFYARFGAGAPDGEAIAAIRQSAASLGALSSERVWSELKRLLVGPRAPDAFGLMRSLGALADWLPEATDAAPLAAMVAAGGPADALLRLACVAPGDPAERLRLSSAERDRLAGLRQAPLLTPSDDPAALRRALADWPADWLIGRTWLGGGFGPAWDGLRATLTTTETPIFPLEGRDALALGMAPGPAVGAALRTVRAWWLAGGCVAAGPACRARLAELARG